MWAKNKQSGFTIVELLIVIVVIAILAAISIVAYNGIQQRARDTQRKSDIATITKALELYYINEGQYPPSVATPSSAVPAFENWSNTSDNSWLNLINHLKPYASGIGKDPISTPNSSVLTSGVYNYSYFTNRTGTSYCGAQPFQVYIIIYRLESGNQENNLIGNCSASQLGPYAGVSNYRMSKLQ